MKLTPTYIALVFVGALVYFGAVYAMDRVLSRRVRVRVGFRYVAAASTVVGFFYIMHRFVDDHARSVDISKAMIALVAAGCVFYEAHRAGIRRPVAERWKKFIGVTLGIAAIVAYFNGFRFGYARYYHRWDQFHYYMGAKYFREMGYDGLYKCALIAQDELGVVRYDSDSGRSLTIDMSKEVHHADKKIRNLGGDNLLMPAAELLEHPEICKAGFTPARWDQFKADVQFFRTSSDKGYWEDMQKDHGYNPPPVWTIAGWAFASLFAAGKAFAVPILGKVIWLQVLAMLDVAYLAGTFVALWWAFGWRTFAVGAIFWGCQSSAPFYWTGGAFLRQDWLFWLVLSACCVRKKHYEIAGASMVYAGLLRIFPGLAVIGWLTAAGWAIHRSRAKTPFDGNPFLRWLGFPWRMPRQHRQVLLGGMLAAAVLIPTSLAVCGKDAYQQFYKHTIEVHDQTPLTNHMGLRVLVAHKIGSGFNSGRMKYTKDTKLVDPFEVWKRMRNERYHKYRYVAYAIVLATFVLFAWVLRRVRSLWIAQCLGQIWIILLSQLTCYYYSFMILTAPLAKANRQLEAPLFGLAALSQFVWITFYWNDDKYTALTAISLAFCYLVMCMFAPRGLYEMIVSSGSGRRPAAAGDGSLGATTRTP